MASMGRAPAFGRSSTDSYAHYDPITSSLKTHRTLRRRVLTESFVTLPKAGMMQNGTVYERTISVRHTCGSDCILLPTPIRSDKNDRGVNTNYSERRNGPQGSLRLAAHIGGPSNPNHREWLMGFPQDWTKITATELRLLGTRSFRKSLNT
jgi:hypothetical protein